MSCKSPNKHSDIYTSILEEGFDLRYAEKLWNAAALSELQLELLVSLDKEGAGLNKVGAYMNGLVNEFRSKKFKARGSELGNKFVRESMNLKIRGEKHNHRELEQEKRELRHNLW